MVLKPGKRANASPLLYPLAHNKGTEPMQKLAITAAVLATLNTTARADDLVVYGAGSLREAIGQIAAEFGQAHGLAVTTQFGPSGRMRERIENGERVDLFASADVGHARKLVQDGRASVMAVFVRNTLCLHSPASPQARCNERGHGRPMIAIPRVNDCGSLCLSAPSVLHDMFIRV